MKYFCVLGLMILLAGCGGPDESQVMPETKMERASYSLGVEAAKALMWHDSLGLDPKFIALGAQDQIRNRSMRVHGIEQMMLLQEIRDSLAVVEGEIVFNRDVNVRRDAETLSLIHI